MLLRESSDMRFDGTFIRQVIKAGIAGDWSELVKSDRLNVWPSAKLQECHIEVTQEDDERKSIERHFLQKSTDFLRRIIVPVVGQGGVTLSCRCLHCHRLVGFDGARRT